MSQPKNYLVHTETGGYTHVLAADPDDAVEQYYAVVESILGHHLKICSCFGEPKKLDRTKVLQPVSVELWDGKDPYV